MGGCVPKDGLEPRARLGASKNAFARLCLRQRYELEYAYCGCLIVEKQGERHGNDHGERGELVQRVTGTK